ncbi:Uncharacterized protein BP5553_00997 [Venustampulla echinocandica]|uniref:SAGA-associated factor 11 n=1 Tax=Venustampulla echinocandica TaxID=2656787 RepID=A0A370TZU2_9HELO|nr:Uncharacterized protein BP5553_00997 [Venustampulla echinocandica]RDL41018.1 Uncharacterized protein BP5553_00997 [Venustampulla echinocandica]
MPTNDSFPQTGIVAVEDDQSTDNMGVLAHSILDDIVYNIIHDIVLKTHREEKMAKGTSAAILVEQKATQTAPPSDDSNSASDHPPHKVEIDSAIYEDGKVYLKGNPLKMATEVICPKCHLPRLLYPTDGSGARKPDPGREYCKKRPFIEKPYHDIYGQTFQMEGPGRGKKKKDMINPLLQSAKENTPSGSQDSPASSPPPGEGPAKPISFPHAKCHNCNTFLPIKRMNNHMIKCIGGGGRDSSRAALLKIQNGNGNGSQNGNTPPGSRNSTPAPAGHANPKGKSSPNKREAGDDFDSDSSPQKKKKVIKKTAATKLKAPKMARSTSQLSSSNLSFEQKVPATDDEDDDGGGDDDGDGEYGTVIVEPKKKVIRPVVKKSKESGSLAGAERKKKWLHGKGGVKPSFPPADLADASSSTAGSTSGIKIKIKNNGTAANGESRPAGSKTVPSKGGDAKNLVVNGETKAQGAGGTSNGKPTTGVIRADSESSQTLSSPS